MSAVHPLMQQAMWFAPKPKMTHEQAIAALHEIENQFQGDEDEIGQFLHCQTFNVRSDVQGMLAKRREIDLEGCELLSMPATVGRDDQPSWGKA